MIKKLGFTLAEVLITLAIIGVVAVLTVPTLITNNQEKGWNTASKVFEAKLEQALKVMNTQGTLAGYRTTKDFVDELSNHLKIVKVCDSDKLTDCFSDKVYWGADKEEVDISSIARASDFGQNDWGTELVGIQLANGTNGIVAYNPDCKQNQFSNQITGTSCLAILYDTSGYSKPNTQNKDLRSKNVASLGGEDCAFKIGGTCYGTPFTPTPHVWKGCDKKGTTTNEEDLAFMSKYGITYCLKSDYGTNDYWAGTVEACGGVQNMPSDTQLAEIANYVYNANSVQANNNVEDLTMDISKASPLGFTLGLSTFFYVWSGEERSNSNAYYRRFYSTNTYWGSTLRGTSINQAVCIK